VVNHETGGDAAAVVVEMDEVPKNVGGLQGGIPIQPEHAELWVGGLRLADGALKLRLGGGTGEGLPVGRRNREDEQQRGLGPRRAGEDAGERLRFRTGKAALGEGRGGELREIARDAPAVPVAELFRVAGIFVGFEGEPGFRLGGR